MIASFQGHADIVRILIEAKAQINTQEAVCYTMHYHTQCHCIRESVDSLCRDETDAPIA